jgi:hypothetical protein
MHPVLLVLYHINHKDGTFSIICCIYNLGVVTPTGAMKEDNKLIVSRTDDDEAVIRPAPVDQQVEQNGSVPQKNPDLNAPHNSIILHFSKDGQKQDLSLGLDTILSSPSTVSSNNR